MKRLYIILCLLTLVCCLNSLLSQNVVSKNKYDIQVVAIDSTKDYIIIYAESLNRKHKIVTRKVEQDCRNVTVLKNYAVTLTSLNENDNSNLFNSRCEVHYGWGDGNIILNEEEWECDIFLVDEIFGLCFTSDTLKIMQYEQWLEKNPVKHTRSSKKPPKYTIRSKVMPR